MTSIKKTISVLIISTLTINCSFAQWSEDANNIWGTAGGKSIGIGTATPKAKLEVMGEIKGYTQLHLGENYDAINGRGIIVDNGGSTSWELLTLRNDFGTHFKVDGNGNVGIGTTNPLGKIDISLASNGGGRLIFGNNPNDNKIFIEGFNKDATGSASEVLITGMNASNLPKFSVLADKAFLSGSLGIGTNAPKEKLDVMGGIGSTRDVNEGGYISLSNSLKTDPAVASTWSIYNMTGGYGNSLQFWGYSNTATLGPKFVINDNGNVGIGTSFPKAKLHVSGSFQVSNQWLLECSNNTLGIGHGSSGSGLYLGALAIGYNYGSLGSLVDCTADAFIAGRVGIGTTTPTEKLSVNGNIKAKKLIVTQTGWADYVFDKNYTLMPVDSLSTYIKTHKHLPEMPTTKDVQENGVDVGNNQTLLLKKIEELTLYIIDQHKEIEALKKKIK